MLALGDAVIVEALLKGSFLVLAVLLTFGFTIFVHELGHFLVARMCGMVVDVFAIEATSKLASLVEMAMYFATEPKPGLLSVIGRSLSTVFGI